MSDSHPDAPSQRHASARLADLSITSSRVPELDGLRGIAVLMVLLLHTRPTWFFWGWAGVDLFLVLSGFLITRILLENLGQPGMLRAFYIRRALRIWPVYYLTLFLTAALFAATSSLQAGVDAAIPDGHWRSLLFLQNTEHYLPESRPVEYIWFFEHSWSVAVEEQFYLFWPVILLALGSRRLALPLLAAVALAAAYAARAHSMSPHILLTRVDGLVLGAAIAYATSRSPQRLESIGGRPLLYLALAGAALAAPYLLLGAVDPGTAFGERAAPVLGLSLLFALAVFLSLRHSGSRRLRWLRSGLLRWFGRISFGLYMYHVPIGYLGLVGVNLGLWDRPFAKALMWGASLAVAHASYVWMEKPILSLGKSTPYRPAGDTPAASVGAGRASLEAAVPGSSDTLRR